MYAEAVTRLLAVLGKPCTLSLHGGNLPDFAGRFPGRTARVLNRAKLVICVSPYLFEKLKPLRSDMQLVPNAIHVGQYPFRTKGPGSARLLWLRAFHQIYNPQMAVESSPSTSFRPGCIADDGGAG